MANEPRRPYEPESPVTDPENDPNRNPDREREMPNPDMDPQQDPGDRNRRRDINRPGQRKS